MADTTKGRVPFTGMAPLMMLGQSDSDSLKWDDVNGNLVQDNAVVVPTLVKTVTVTSAQLLALFTTAVEIVPAPGAGLVLDFLGAVLTYKIGPTPTAYTIGSAGNLTVNYTDKSGVLVSTVIAVTGLLDQATQTSVIVKPLFATIAAFTTGTPINQKLVLKLATADPTAGDGTLIVNAYYRVLDTLAVALAV